MIYIASEVAHIFASLLEILLDHPHSNIQFGNLNYLSVNLRYFDCGKFGQISKLPASQSLPRFVLISVI